MPAFCENSISAISFKQSEIQEMSLEINQNINVYGFLRAFVHMAQLEHG